MKYPISVICLAVFIAATSGYAGLSLPMPHALTPEEHMMYVLEQRGHDWRALSPQQRCERQRQMQRDWAAMSPADLQNLRQQLDARWNALPDLQKQHLEQRIQKRFANRRARHMMGPAPAQWSCGPTGSGAL
jgi:hypothetical protein